MNQYELANKLGVSKTTVSRALSGKGRIGEETRNQILKFAREQGMIVKEQDTRAARTRNIGVVFPSDAYSTGSPYFHDCLYGICETASLMDYDVLITTRTVNDITGIRTLVENAKVDGIILTRSLEDDKAIRYLTDIHFPTGLTGICEYDEVIQVDTDNEAATENLTSLLIRQGFSKFALIVEDMTYHVNRCRFDGFYKALLKNGISEHNQALYTGSLKKEILDAIISDVFSKKVECIVCGDDVVCTWIMSKLQADGYRIPRDIAVASLYNSSNLNCFSPAVTAVNVPASQVGNMIGKQMINFLSGNEYKQKTKMDYEIMLRKSTICNKESSQ
jgi:DNA-binding LacI/PurR family transcriptional regulator